MNLKDLMLSEMSHAEKDKRDLTYKRNLKSQFHTRIAWWLQAAGEAKKGEIL